MADASDGRSPTRATPRPGYRINAYVPADLHEAFREAHPGAKLSVLLQEAMRAALDCDHEVYGCLRCGEEQPRHEVEAAVLEAFFHELYWRLGSLIRAGSSIEHAQRLLKDVGDHFGIKTARRAPLTRLTRQERRRAKVKEMPLGAARRRPAPAPVVEVVAEDQGDVVEAVVS